MADDDSQHAYTDPSEAGATSATSSRPRRIRIAALVVLALLPLALTALAQPFLPDTVPLHFGASGVPDEWGPKARLFVTAGIVAVLGFVITGIYAVVARQKETGREDWLVIEGGMSFPGVAVVLGIMALMQAFYLFIAFQLTDTALPNVTGHLYMDILLVLVLAAMLAPALYMLVTGKGLSLVNFHPGTSDLERRTGADTQQARAIGCLLLFLALFVFVEFMIVRW